MADQPWAFLYYRERFWLVNGRIDAFPITPKNQLLGSGFYNQVWLDN